MLEFAGIAPFEGGVRERGVPRELGRVVLSSVQVCDREDRVCEGGAVSVLGRCCGGRGLRSCESEGNGGEKEERQSEQAHCVWKDWLGWWHGYAEWIGEKIGLLCKAGVCEGLEQ